MRFSKQLPVLLIIVATVGCFAKRAEPVPQPKVELSEQDVTPPSELALLMRHMAAHADSVKAGLARGDKNLPPYPEEIKTLFTATPTADMHIDPITFPTFGKDYQQKVAALYSAAKKDRTYAYNALVLSCANCHGTHCPGPLRRINKMYVPVTQ
ncbi:MAG: hypothetical protein ABI432_17085 [Flavobacteriales bacterium]